MIPNYASAKLYARSLTKDQLTILKAKMENCFKAAAKATGCTVDMSWSPSGPTDGKTKKKQKKSLVSNLIFHLLYIYIDVFMNTTLAEYYKQLMEEQGVEYRSQAEEEKIVGGSTDMGNISYAVPSIHPAFGIYTTATNHTREFAQAAGTAKAHQATLRAATCLSITAAHVYLSDEFYQSVMADFKKGKPQNI